MDLKDIIITPETDKALIPFIRSYQPHTITPTRADLIDVEYTEPYQLTGHVTLRNIAGQQGIELDSYLKELRKAEAAMARAMEDDNDDT